MTELAREYGEGLYELARDEDIRPQLHRELMEIAALISAQPAFIRLLGSRNIERPERLKVVDETFGDRAHPYIVNFMKILVEREKIDAFPDCAKWFHQRYNDDFGIVEARVTTAYELDDEAAAALKNKLEQMTGKHVSIISRVDPAIIGGVCVEMNGQKFDNSIQNRLERLKYDLTGNL